MLTCKYHCRGCGGHFASLKAFDLHRTGPYEGDRSCSYPEVDSKGNPIPWSETPGECRISDPDNPKLGQTIYGLEPTSREKARWERLRAVRESDRSSERAPC